MIGQMRCRRGHTAGVARGADTTAFVRIYADQTEASSSARRLPGRGGISNGALAVTEAGLRSSGGV